MSMCILAHKHFFRIPRQEEMAAPGIKGNNKIATRQMHQHTAIEFFQANPGIYRSNRAGSASQRFPRSAFPYAEIDFAWTNQLHEL